MNSIQKSKYNLVLCELYNEYLHGTSDNLEGHYLSIYTHNYNEDEDDYEHDSEEDYDDDEDDDDEFWELNSIRHLYIQRYKSIQMKQHRTIRNYSKLITEKLSDYIKPEIAEKIIIDDCHCVILKTFWIRIFQRKWRRFIREKQRFIRFCSQPWVLFYREIHGKWPQIK
jgi:hypothetical protein